MITFYHSPNSRSTTVATAIEEMGVGDRITTRIVSYSTPRRALAAAIRTIRIPKARCRSWIMTGAIIWERPAILTYLSDLFPDAARDPCRRPSRTRAVPVLAGLFTATWWNR